MSLSGISFPAGVTPILEFRQKASERCTPFMLKLYVNAIAAHHAPIAGQSVGINNLIVKFLRGARKLNPPCPLTVPPWDLSMVLKAL